VVSNEELAARLGEPAAALERRTGIRQRCYVESGTGPSDLARTAAASALERAGLGPADVDLIVFATMTPDIAFPGPGCFLQHKLGCDTVGALDIRAQCAGFVFALATADRFIRAGAARRVLVACAEVYSSALDFSPRAAGITPFFGDGAGVVIVEASAAPGVLATVMHSDPAGLERFWCEFPASRHFPARMDRTAFEAGRHYYELAIDAIHPQAERELGNALREVLERADVSADRVALFLAHYLDPRVARRALEAAGVPPARIVATAEAAGHLGAAAIPLALAGAVEQGRVGRGDLVACVAFGAGMSWGGALVHL
jgi:3-oxoacyl-[acyl-carrier-protein] synthase-3